MLSFVFFEFFAWNTVTWHPLEYNRMFEMVLLRHFCTVQHKKLLDIGPVYYPLFLTQFLTEVNNLETRLRPNLDKFIIIFTSLCWNFKKSKASPFLFSQRPGLSTQNYCANTGRTILRSRWIWSKIFDSVIRGTSDITFFLRKVFISRFRRFIKQ